MCAWYKRAVHHLSCCLEQELDYASFVCSTDINGHEPNKPIVHPDRVDSSGGGSKIERDVRWDGVENVSSWTAP